MEDQLTTRFLAQTINNRYQIISLLGSGAMGHVYLAEDSLLKRKVAIKVLRGEWGEHEEVNKRLENECKLMAHLGNHQNIVALIDRLVYQNSPMIVMEYAEGEPLSQILARTAVAHGVESDYKLSDQAADKEDGIILSPSIIQDIVEQCLTALEYAHTKGVLHLDIKPANMIIHKNKEGQINVKLTDFGIGQTRRDISLTSAVTALTFTSEGGVGTPAYMAPEQIEPDRFGKFGPATDLYSFAVMLFEMLTLRLPFSGAYTEVLHAHANTSPPDPRDFNPSIPASLARVVLKGLRKSPSNRHANAEEMLLDFQGRLDPNQRVKNTFKLPKDKKLSTLSTVKKLFSQQVRLVVLVLLLTGVAFFTWRSFFSGEKGPGSGGMSREEARASAAKFRDDLEKTWGDDLKNKEYRDAMELFEKAEKAESGRESVQLFFEAQSTFVALKKQKEADRKQQSEDEKKAAEQAEIAAEKKKAKEEEEKIADAPKASPLVRVQNEVIDLGNGISLEMIWVPSGVFLMGDDVYRGPAKKGGSKSSDTSPAREIWIPKAFWIGKYEVTQAQWKAIMGNNPSRFNNSEQNPVDSVTWNDCQLFIQKLNARVPGGGFRLPSEAEWEYATRAGSNAPFFYGSSSDKLKDYGWFSFNSAGSSQEVGKKTGNTWGLCDTNGNVMEWVQDWYDADYYKVAPSAYPVGPATGTHKVLRGGSWSMTAENCTSAVRHYAMPDMALDTYGLRLVRNASDEKKERAASEEKQEQAASEEKQE
ncbi:MAG TPA: bifunctional serine/threonine-protein kinase/formylglycine-generating enzyme family protein [Candidatus Hydrogenedentes bacterium]|jgi:serine/threonine protein kinase/formylglycine-generating enzyme required for sulfatase activity|nr:bifunctional serine/threonine-protein kinase/formylglycine-generating enzyme family protein [Candidatus Hydrogenedentota bacterium]HOR51862.1 bifunctional serine/threonine-protein kinase/formylglycine-generating enzyme family protein [Candidatus Hydrogenedentota bacterium]HPK26064.1 bifunctional serine/threonine-protein kinase/formylglycine-generating enzyme family protein [Candidatus Hydrogenedentota bacterium]HPX87474.1 bifunctional serine/threonine-protein kinase/formylglycine-generating e